VQRVTELVEERLGLVGRQKRRRVTGRSGEVEDTADDRRPELALPYPLFPDREAPGTATPALPRIER